MERVKPGWIQAKSLPERGMQKKLPIASEPLQVMTYGAQTSSLELENMSFVMISSKLCIEDN